VKNGLKNYLFFDNQFNMSGKPTLDITPNVKEAGGFCRLMAGLAEKLLRF
jgi:hypothetical protein